METGIDQSMSDRTVRHCVNKRSFGFFQLRKKGTLFMEYLRSLEKLCKKDCQGFIWLFLEEGNKFLSRWYELCSQMQPHGSRTFFSMVWALLTNTTPRIKDVLLSQWLGENKEKNYNYQQREKRRRLVGGCWVSLLQFVTNKV